jgi:HAD superfamily phosphatase
MIETVHHYSGWRPEAAVIDALKGEGAWNNDWEASYELLRRRQGTSALALPDFADLVQVFGDFYFGGDPEGDPGQWRGFIGCEPLLVSADFFADLNRAGFLWGFVSGAEPPSVRYVLQQRLGLVDPPVLAMGDAPDKPDPTGLLQLAGQICEQRLGSPLEAAAPVVAYLGDTVADVQTVLNARQVAPELRLISLAVAPPHLHGPDQGTARQHYEQRLSQAGADRILSHTNAVIPSLGELLDT